MVLVIVKLATGSGSVAAEVPDLLQLVIKPMHTMNKNSCFMVKIFVLRYKNSPENERADFLVYCKLRNSNA
jgi:hypothetical protein